MLTIGVHSLPSGPPSAVWPAVSHSSLRHQATKSGSSSALDILLSPPKFSLNGVPNAPPLSPYKKSFSELEESKVRRRELDTHEPTYPGIVPASSRDPTSATSPIIPLSPDPFGRFPSFPSTPSTSSTSQSSTFLDKPMPQPKAKYSAVDVSPEQYPSTSPSHRESAASNLDDESRPLSSRFSLDSTDEGKNNRISASLNPVKSIKSLWKKGRKLSISSSSGVAAVLPTGTGPPSPQPPPPPVPSMSSSSTPRSLTPAPSTASRESVTSLVIPDRHHAPKSPYHDTPSLTTSQLQQSRSTPSINSMFFNQESPYPVHVLPPGALRRRRTASQTARVISTTSLAEADDMPPLPSASSTTEKDKAIVPKSILKSRRTESSASQMASEQHARPRSQSRTDSMVSRSRSFGGGSGGGVTPPSSSSSESTRISPTKSRQPPRPNIPPLPS
jgi:hypothetical protein